MLYTEKVECFNGQVVLAASLILLKGAFSLELVGLKRKGESAFAQAKRLFNLKGNKQKVYDQFISILEENEILKKKS